VQGGKKHERLSEKGSQGKTRSQLSVGVAWAESPESLTKFVNQKGTNAAKGVAKGAAPRGNSGGILQ